MFHFDETKAFARKTMLFISAAQSEINTRLAVQAGNPGMVIVVLYALWPVPTLHKRLLKIPLGGSLANE